ncbi:hypothetical protein B0H16DRAFT_808810 [Mycena metata]|uniref:Uncharacterized protein n=1 Tax=Mycena metata TaxID=1033252 RepID=A0AAD7NWZ2_9AGAR|nr:hypothetical protein B0H16DRAFT_808810 [Mycena metata]
MPPVLPLTPLPTAFPSNPLHQRVPVAVQSIEPRALSPLVPTLAPTKSDCEFPLPRYNDSPNSYFKRRRGRSRSPGQSHDASRYGRDGYGPPRYTSRNHLSRSPPKRYPHDSRSPNTSRLDIYYVPESLPCPSTPEPLSQLPRCYFHPDCPPPDSEIPSDLNYGPEPPPISTAIPTLDNGPEPSPASTSASHCANVIHTSTPTPTPQSLNMIVEDTASLLAEFWITRQTIADAAARGRVVETELVRLGAESYALTSSVALSLDVVEQMEQLSLRIASEKVNLREAQQILADALRECEMPVVVPELLKLMQGHNEYDDGWC